MNGGAGYDGLNGGNGNDSLNAGSGSEDDLYGDAGDDIINAQTTTYLWAEGGAGNDTINGGAGDDDLYGDVSAWTDPLSTDTGNDVLYGNAGNDRLDGGLGADSMSGGLGNDTYMVDNYSDVVTENASEGTADTVRSSLFMYSLGANVENLRLTGSAFMGGGNELNNVITAGNSGSYLMGNAGNDSLNGGAGSDWLDGGTGNDSMAGGLGDDTYIVNGYYDVVTENTNGGTDTVQCSYFMYNLGANVENLTLTGNGYMGAGNGLNNVITVSNASNVGSYILGGAGNDTLNGGAGYDGLNGGNGNDSLNAGSGSEDDLYGDAGDDIINAQTTTYLWAEGGAGNDTINGGAGDDDLYGDVSAWTDPLSTDTGNDVLYGNAGNDRLDGGLGADSMSGGLGNDICILGRGYGTDTVVENDITSGNTDVAQFLTGVTINQLWFQHVANNLEVSILGTTDKLVIKDWYLGTAEHVEQFKTTDGSKTLLDTNVYQLVDAMAAFAAPPAVTTMPTNDPVYSNVVQVIAANWH